MKIKLRLRTYGLDCFKCFVCGDCKAFTENDVQKIIDNKYASSVLSRDEIEEQIKSNMTGWWKPEDTLKYCGHAQKFSGFWVDDKAAAQDVSKAVTEVGLFGVRIHEHEYITAPNEAVDVSFGACDKHLNWLANLTDYCENNPLTKQFLRAIALGAEVDKRNTIK